MVATRPLDEVDAAKLLASAECEAAVLALTPLDGAEVAVLSNEAAVVAAAPMDKGKTVVLLGWAPDRTSTVAVEMLSPDSGTLMASARGTIIFSSRSGSSSSPASWPGIMRSMK